MAFATLTIQGRAVSGLGPEIQNAWKGDNTTLYTRGQLLQKKNDGTVVPAVAGHATLGIHLVYTGATLTAATADFVTVSEITEDTRFDVQALGDTAAQADIGDEYDYEVSVSAPFLWGINMNTASSSGLGTDLQITQIYANTHDYDTGSDEAGAEGIVQVKLRSARMTAAPA